MATETDEILVQGSRDVARSKIKKTHKKPFGMSPSWEGFKSVFMKKKKRKKYKK